MIDIKSQLSSSIEYAKNNAPFKLNIHPSIVALLVLIICEILWFGPIIGRIGFYLDDWGTYSNLYLNSQDWHSLISTAFADGRLAIRPLEAVFFTVSSMAFGYHPLWHHIVNCIFEVLSSWFCYLILFKLSKNYSLALLASLLMLVYPSHDATHYWATANTISLSMLLYMFSLWQTLCAVENGKIIRRRLLLAVLVYLASLLNYEAFLPLCVVNFVCLLSLLKKDNPWHTAFQKSILAFCPFVLSILIAFAYQRIIVLGLAKVQHPTIAIDVMHFLKVLSAGLNSTLSPTAVNFFIDRAKEASVFAFTAPYVISIVFLAITIIAAMQLHPKDENQNLFHPFAFVGIGTLIFCASYSIYGIATGYVPALNSIYNRINYGGSVGSSFIIAGLLGIICYFLGRLKTNRLTSNLSKIVFTTVATFLITFFVIVDWGMSLPWITSWSFQQSVVAVIKSKRTQLHNGDSVLLADAPRYVMWAPVFDGVWDFQAMLQLVTRNKNINGGVVSERLVLSKDSAKDISLGFLCATYPFHHLFLLVMCPREWIPINSADDFIAAVSAKGMDHGLSKSILVNWKNQLAISKQPTPH